MKNFHEVLSEAFEPARCDGGVVIYRSFVFGENARYELAVEPLLDGKWHVALYDHAQAGDEPFGGGALLLSDKLPVRPGGYPR